MALSIGIIGLPNVGKSTLFNALLKKRVALSANYPFTTVEPNVGVVAVPDERLEKLAELIARSTSEESKPTSEVLVMPPIIPAVVEFVDIAGLVKGAHKGEGLGNQFLSHIREVDAIIHVLRDFDDPNVVRAGGSVSPKEDKELIETELALADLEKEDKLSEKPVLYVYNVSEEHLGGEKNARFAARRAITPPRWKEVEDDNSLAICAKLEEELADLSEDERVEYLKELGPPAGGEETGLERLIKAAYKILDLVTFYTIKGGRQVHAWSLKNGQTALDAAAKVHSDFEKGFIRAQVIEYEKLIEAGSYGSAKQKGWIRAVGKDYIVKDGDVIEFLVGN